MESSRCQKSGFHAGSSAGYGGRAQDEWMYMDEHGRHKVSIEAL